MLYQTLQNLIKQNWKLRHIRLESGKITATVAGPKIKYDYNWITFDNDYSHITIPDYKEFQLYDEAVFSNIIDTKVLIIQDRNIRIHIELGK